MDVAFQEFIAHDVYSVRRTGPCHVGPIPLRIRHASSASGAPTDWLASSCTPQAPPNRRPGSPSHRIWVEASLATHEHGRSVRRFASPIKGVGRHYTRFWRAEARKSATFRANNPSN